MEATGGFEPPNRGFADLRLNHLATSPRYSVQLDLLTCRQEMYRDRLAGNGAEGGI
jgi:hypothetical protein